MLDDVERFRSMLSIIAVIDSERAIANHGAEPLILGRLFIRQVTLAAHGGIAHTQIPTKGKPKASHDASNERHQCCPFRRIVERSHQSIIG
jgi:hypothetical protein